MPNSFTLPLSTVRPTIAFHARVGQHSLRLEFVPVNNVPGWSHRVAIGVDGATPRLESRWLAEDFRPNRKSAHFFLEQYLQSHPELTAPTA